MWAARSCYLFGIYQQWVRFWYKGELLELPAELQQRLSKQAEQIDKQAEKIVEQAQQIGQLQDQVQQVLDRMRRQVEKRALKAGRRDILERLPATTDLDQFDAWLAELE